MNNRLLPLWGLLAIVGIGLLLYLVSPESSKQTPENITIKVGGLPVVQGLPFFLALEKGSFKEAGLNVEYTPFENPNQVVDAVLSHQIDVTHTGGPMGIASIANFKSPGKLKIYAGSGGNADAPSDSLLVRSDSTIASFEDLRGKKPGMLSGIQWRTIAMHILRQNNLVVDQDVTLVELAQSLQVQALAQGQIDALLAIQPIPTVVQTKAIGREIISVPTVKYVANPFYGGAGIVNMEFLEKNPVVAGKFFAVLKSSIDEIGRNPEAARKALQKYTGLDETTASRVPLPIVKMSTDFTENDINAIQEFIDIFSTYSVVDEKMPISPLLYESL